MNDGTRGTEAGLARHWTLDPRVVYLNHGSFGACPREVLAAQAELRARLEREPVQFFLRTMPPLADAARAAVADFVGADPDDLAFVPNATTGVNTVLRSLDLAPGDELLATDHGYNACRNALEYVAARTGARLVIARVPFPLAAPARVTEAVLACVTPRTRLALLDHVTSPTGLVFPLAELIAALSARGIETLVDGAHAPGMLALDLHALGAAYYTGNLHKWVCAPKGAAFLHVRRDRQAAVHPLTISHGANSPRADRTRFRLEFDWTGTADPTAALCVPTALRVLAAMVPGGWDAVRARNRALALEARGVLMDALGLTAPPAPDAMLGALVALPLPPPAPTARPDVALEPGPLQAHLFDAHHIEVPIVPWPAPPSRLVRVSAQLYNDVEQYRRLAAALVPSLEIG